MAAAKSIKSAAANTLSNPQVLFAQRMMDIVGAEPNLGVAGTICYSFLWTIYLYKSGELIWAAYHPERKLTGTAENVLHIHYYDKNLKRTDATYLDKATFEKNKKYLKGMKWYDKR